MNFLNRFDEAFLERVLQQIAAGPGFDRANNIPFVAVHAQDQNGCIGRMPQQLDW